MLKVRWSWTSAMGGGEREADVPAVEVHVQGSLVVFLDRGNRPILVVPQSHLIDAAEAPAKTAAG